MVARTGKPADPGTETVKNGCIYWAGFCIMCPFSRCLLGVSRRERRQIITAHAIKILTKNCLTMSVIQACMKVSRDTIYRALKEG